MIDTVASEWLKLRSTRSTWIILAIIPATVALFGLLVWSATRAWDSIDPARRADSVSMSSIPAATGLVVCLLLAILGAQSITSEYSTGMIRMTFTATAERWRVLAAKGMVMAAVATICGQLAVFGSHVVTSAVVGDRPISGAPGSLAAEWWRLVASGLSVTMFALLGLGLGAITRSIIATIGIVVTLWYIFPIIAINVPEPWQTRVGSILPSSLADQLASAADGTITELNWLPPAVAGLAMLAYAVIPLLIALLIAPRRDA